MAERELTAAEWRAYREGEFPRTAWDVDGDVLHAQAQGTRVDLITRERFGNFTLLFDWRLPRAGSSAVFCRVNEDAGPPGNTGPALQLLDDEHHPDGADALTSCGALFGIMAPWHDRRRIASTYHSARIVFQGSLIEFWIDDQQVVGCDLESPEVRARISRSRFRDCADFARLKEGHIVLRHRGTDAWYRRLRIDVA
jgi:Domain of Unknown Function (DUF1080)